MVTERRDTQSCVSAWLAQLRREFIDELPWRPVHLASLRVGDDEDFAGELCGQLLGTLKILDLRCTAQRMRLDAVGASSPHAHMVVLQQDGVSRFETGRQHVKLSPGGWVLLRTRQPIRIEHLGAVHQLVLMNPFAAAELGQLPAGGMWICSGDSELARVGARWLRYATEPCLWDRFDGAEDLARALTCLIAEALRQEPLADASSARQVPSPARLLEYMVRHLQESRLDLASLARAFGCSARSIQRAFSGNGSLPFEQTLLRMRVELAARSLAAWGYRRFSLAELSRRCGFKSSSQLSIKFRIQMGQTPAEFLRIQTNPPACWTSLPRPQPHGPRVRQGLVSPAGSAAAEPAPEPIRGQQGEIGPLRFFCGSDAQYTPLSVFITQACKPGNMLVLQLSGSSTFDVDGSVFEMRPNCLLLVRTPVRMNAVNRTPGRQLVLFVAAGPLGNLFPSQSVVRMRHVGDRLGGLALQWLDDACHLVCWRQNELADRVAMLLVRLALHAIESAYIQCPPAEPDLTFGRISSHLQEHLQDPRLRATRVAADFGCSASTVHRLFRHAGDVNFTSTLFRLRLEACAEAMAQIENASFSITNLALQFGFSNPAHFSVKFRARYGCTPSEYRRDVLASQLVPSVLEPTED